MASKEIKYQPLERSSEDLPEGISVQHYATTSGTKRWERLFWVFCIVALLIGNGVWVFLYSHQKEVQVTNGFTTLVPYHFSTPYIDENVTMANQLWAELFPPGFGAIKVDHEWAAENHLPPTQGNASDGKAIYTVAVFHHLHCLTVIRASLFQFNAGREQVDPWSHIVHCIDAIRQQIQCLADPNLGGVATDHDCRDFDALKEWTAERAYLEFLDVI